MMVAAHIPLHFLGGDNAASQGSARWFTGDCAENFSGFHSSLFIRVETLRPPCRLQTPSSTYIVGLSLFPAPPLPRPAWLSLFLAHYTGTQRLWLRSPRPSASARSPINGAP